MKAGPAAIKSWSKKATDQSWQASFTSVWTPSLTSNIHGYGKDILQYDGGPSEVLHPNNIYTCQVSRLRRDCHACGSKTAISRPLTPAFPFLTPGGIYLQRFLTKFFRGVFGQSTSSTVYFISVWSFVMLCLLCCVVLCCD